MKSLKDYEFYKEDLVTIYHGDCLEVLPFLEGDFTLFTDPPYYNKFDPSWMSKMNVSKKNRAGEISAEKRSKPNVSDDNIDLDPGMDLSFLFKYPKRLIFGYPYIMDSEATGWIVWAKQLTSWRKMTSPVEIAATTLRTGFDYVQCLWAGYYKDTKETKGEKRYDHPTQKPLKVIKGCIGRFVDKGSIILDPFLGSGTTCVAAKMLGYKSIGIEKELKYCELSVDRIKFEIGYTMGVIIKKHT